MEPPSARQPNSFEEPPYLLAPELGPFGTTRKSPGNEKASAGQPRERRSSGIPLGAGVLPVGRGCVSCALSTRKDTIPTAASLFPPAARSPTGRSGTTIRQLTAGLDPLGTSKRGLALGRRALAPKWWVVSGLESSAFGLLLFRLPLLPRCGSADRPTAVCLGWLASATLDARRSALSCAYP